MKIIEPNTSIPGLEGPTVADFWSWAYSDIMSNRNRSVFAEFVVATALDVIDEPRIEWDAVDLRYKGKKIEVKASAYLQSWYQKELSTIAFDIRKKRPWDAKSNVIADEPVRSADCYVFCLYPEKDSKKINILDVNSWEFYVLTTEKLEMKLGDQKSVGINRLRSMCDSIHYDKLKLAIDGSFGI